MTVSRYPQSLIALHWIALLLLLAAYASMELEDAFARGSEGRQLMFWLHTSAGLSVLALVLPRLLLRLRAGVPPVTPPLSSTQRIAAAAGHAALYLFMIGMPLIGWLLLSAAGREIGFWGLALPSLLAPDRALAHALEALHEAAASLGYLLIAVHIGAALYHHALRRDDTLTRMLPGR